MPTRRRRRHRRMSVFPPAFSAGALDRGRPGGGRGPRRTPGRTWPVTVLRCDLTVPSASATRCRLRRRGSAWSGLFPHSPCSVVSVSQLACPAGGSPISRGSATSGSEEKVLKQRRPQVRLPAADLDEHGHARLSYQQAETLFSEASGGATLHQLRHFLFALFPCGDSRRRRASGPAACAV